MINLTPCSSVLSTSPHVFLPASKRIVRKAVSSSLAPSHCLHGKYWDYQIIGTVAGDQTHSSNILKARVISRVANSKAPQWAIIKTASIDDGVAKENLKRERQIYNLPGIASARCFRRMYDTFEDHSIALELLETTLANVKYQSNNQCYAIIKAVLKEKLTSCDVLAGQNYVNTDYKPANVLLSGIETGKIVAKVGDLGLVVPAGQLYHAQPFAMRAPEVFLGQPCTEPSQIWAVAAMLLVWMKPGVLGAGNSPHPFINEAWSMAKIKRLFPEWNLYAALNKAKRLTVRTAIELAMRYSEEQEIPRTISPFDEETLKIIMPDELRRLLRLMFVVNPHERPSASSVLTSEEFYDFQNL